MLKTEIKYNQKRLLIGIISIVVIYYVIFDNYHQQIIDFVLEQNSLKLLLVSIIIGLLLLSLLVFLSYFAFLKKSLLVDTMGIHDQSNILKPGLILWKDISEIRIEKNLGGKHILLFVKNTDKYKPLKFNKIKERIAQTNKQIYGTSYIINTNIFQYDSEQLIQLVKNSFIKYA